MATIEIVGAHNTDHGLGRLLVEAVYFLILVVTVTGWTVIGFLVWVPLLIRTTMLLTAVVLYATLFRDQGRVVRAEEALSLAVSFYVRGFEHFIGFYRQRHGGRSDNELMPSEIRWRE